MTVRGLFGLAGLFRYIYLLSAVKGEPQLLGSLEPVIGLVDDDIILPCSLQPPESVAEKTVEWTRSGINPCFVHIFRDGRELYNEQNRNFQQRTSLFLPELKNGNMSLKLSRLKPSDKGNYTCKLFKGKTEKEDFLTQVGVVVGAVSEPIISEYPKGTQVELKCEAKNWYPKPEIEWRYGVAPIISHDSSSTEHDGYYSVYSKIIVETSATGNYTCTVRQQTIHQSREKNVTISDIFRKWKKLKNSQSALGGVLGLCILILTPLILWSVWYMCTYKTSRERFQYMRRPIKEGDETDGLNMNHLEDLQQQVLRLQQENQFLELQNRRLREEVDNKPQRRNSV